MVQLRQTPFMLQFAVCGAGRIGRIHAANLSRHPKASVEWVLDVQSEAAGSLAALVGARAGSSLKQVLSEVDAVLIASPTPTHVELIYQALDGGKAVLCEKPIDLDRARVSEVVQRVQSSGVPFMVGFNRRFDPHFAHLKSELARGAIGTLEMVVITSRDPSPPPISYIRDSGGLFRDMMIHDLDMARWLIGENPVEVYATASNLVDSAIGAEGDVDTAMVTMKTASGVLVQISNSRRAVYGYDQRLEVFGSKGMLRVENQLDSGVVRYGSDGVVSGKPQAFFLERYEAAYRQELNSFIDAVSAQEPTHVEPNAYDGQQALELAETAIISLQRKQPVVFGA